MRHIENIFLDTLRPENCSSSSRWAVSGPGLVLASRTNSHKTDVWLSENFQWDVEHKKKRKTNSTKKKIELSRLSEKRLQLARQLIQMKV